MLRQRAEHKGLSIDSTFRNYNGISMRLSELDYIESNEKTGLSNTSNLFRDMVRMYHDDHDLFASILAQAVSVSTSLDPNDESGSNSASVDIHQRITTRRSHKTIKY